jgi:Nucleotidyl transferase AbiEii toxin, Type IV TA system
MSAGFLHNHPQFADLIRIIAAARNVDPALAEKDYWLTHCLYGLQQLGLKFELKGGTSLSKGFQIIDRFSEDIDIRIEPPADLNVKTGPNQNKPAQIESRRKFYDWLAQTIRIDGVEKVERDKRFDDEKLRSAGIRLFYKTNCAPLKGLKEGILLEVGFDVVTPNSKRDISSWLYDYAVQRAPIIDNRADGVDCYDYRYTFVEKLQTISTKFRKRQEAQEKQETEKPTNIMRHYYDAYALLRKPDVQSFVGTEEYNRHKKARFRTGDNPDISKNEAFTLTDPATRKLYAEAYEVSSFLYYGTKPPFEDILKEFRRWAARL